MRILALEPYYGGSHRAFLDGWVAHSRHEWTVLGLPAYKWKWRMRHAPLTLAKQTRAEFDRGKRWDLIFCSDMLNLAEFKSLAGRCVANLPAVVYFHENQFTYPNRQESERDHHFAFTNYISAMTADSIWFNSNFHRNEFLDALDRFLGRMPDHQDVENVDAISKKSRVEYPGIEEPAVHDGKEAKPLRVLWVSRWEHDKNPADFFLALHELKKTGAQFRVDVLGESFENVPAAFEQIKQEFSSQIDAFGYLPNDEYKRTISRADVVVSTAWHEFFGIAIVEAASVGALPIVPNRLAYPELLESISGDLRTELIYDGTAKGLADRLLTFWEKKEVGGIFASESETVRQSMRRFFWKQRAAEMDARIAEVADHEICNRQPQR